MAKPNAVLVNLQHNLTSAFHRVVHQQCRRLLEELVNTVEERHHLFTAEVVRGLRLDEHKHGVDVSVDGDEVFYFFRRSDQRAVDYSRDPVDA
jgi:hypothetical protein